MIRNRLAAVLLCLAGLGLAGCGFAGPPPATYVLGTPHAAANTEESLIGRRVIDVRRVVMPDYLDGTDLLTRRPGNVMVPSTKGRWGERLSVGFRRALADDLARDLPGFTVTTQQPIDPPFRQVLADVDTFEPRPDGQIVLVARWHVTDGSGTRQLAGENVSLTEQAANESDPAIVAAMSRAIERLAQQVAVSIQSAPSKSAVSDAGGPARHGRR